MGDRCTGNCSRSRERPALVFGLVVFLVVLWPGFVLYLLAGRADEKPGPPAPGVTGTARRAPKDPSMIVHEVRRVRGSANLTKVSALANELRAEGYSPLMSGAPNGGAKVQGVSVRDDREVDPVYRRPGFRSRRSPDFRFYSGAVLETLEAAYKATSEPRRVVALLVQAQTGWSGGGRTFDVYWVPTWVAAVAHSGRVAAPALRALTAALNPELDPERANLVLRVAALLWLEAHPEGRARFVEAFWEAVAELEAALSSAEMLGGDAAVDAILEEIGL